MPSILPTLSSFTTTTGPITHVTVDWNKLKFIELVGQGSFGYVHKALYDRTPVAVKKLQAQMHDTELVNLFQRELNIVRYRGLRPFVCA